MKHTVRRTLLGIALACSPAPPWAAAAQPEAPATGRFEETSPGVTWTGSWSKNAQPATSGGSAMLSMDAGAQASFAFTGVSLSWIGYRDEWSGLADVFLDGVLQTTVDTYATPARAQATLYSISGLREGRHTLAIRAKGTHGSSSAGSWVWIDAFAIPEAPPNSVPSPFDGRRARTPPSSDPPPSNVSRYGPASRGRGGSSFRVEQEDSAVSWSGPWSTNSLALHRGHSARLSMDAAARADFAFSGTGVSWLGYQDEWSGIAEVWLDGELRATIDTYAKPAQAKVELYAIDGLQGGPHILTIKPTGRHRPASSGAWIWVDGFSVAR